MKKGILKKWICFVLSLALLVTSFGVGFTAEAAEEGADQKAAEAQPREVLNFNTDWLYSDTEYANGEAVGLNEESFEPVSVPHANTILDSHKGNDFISQIRSYRFTSWYRRHFTLPEDYRGKRILVEFEGVATIADVYVNGVHLAEHKGAYTGFTVDITDAVRLGGEDNVLAVRVNSKRQTQVPPEGGNVDYCLFGGIVRDVSMTVVSPAYVVRTFVSTPGMLTENGSCFGEDVAVKSTRTTVKNQVDVKNTASRQKTYTVEIEVLEEGGTSRAKASGEVTIPANEEKSVTVETGELKDVHLWNLDDPYQYRMVTRIKDGDQVIDSYDTQFGIRKIGFKQQIQAPYGQDGAIDSNTDGAFYLNGEPVKIIGINRHEQWPWIGRAVPNKLQAKDADMIKANGINAVRCSHYPQDPAFLERCDEIGLLVFEEPPGWQHIGDEEWKEAFKTNLREMLYRDRNHPSIVSWGTSPNESTPVYSFNRECDALAKELDPTRPTHGVRKREDYPYHNNSNENYEVTQDIFTPNYTYPEPPRYVPYIVAEHAFDWWYGSYPDAKDHGTLSYIDTFGSELDYFYRNKTVAGGFGWSMFDYNNEVNYTASQHVFHSGLYDLFRNDKPVAHLYESQWDASDSSEWAPGPVVYIANKWGSEDWGSQEANQRIYVFSNCEEVELFRDGKSLGRIKPNKYLNLPHPVYEFTVAANTYGQGDLEAIGYIGGKEQARDQRQKSGEAVALEAKADYSTLTADGTDMTSVSISAVDAKGNLVPFADNVINVTQISGTKTKLIAEKDVKLEGGRLAFLVQTVRDQTGTAVFKVESKGLIPAECTIAIDPYQADNLVPVPSQITPGTIDPDFARGGSSTINDDEAGDKDYQFDYQGSWTYGSQAGAYKEDNTYSNKANDTCSISFTGAQIRYFGTKAPNHGVASFQIDNGPEIRVDCYAQERQDNALLFDSGYLERNKRHTLTVRVTGDKNLKSTGIWVNADRVELSEKYVVGAEYAIDDSSAGSGKGQFEYQGAWNVNSSTADSWTNEANAAATFRFTGTRVKYYASRKPHHGIAAFSVDGGTEEIVDFYGGQEELDVLMYDSGELEPGDHQLTIRVTGEKSAGATDAYIPVEKVMVTNNPGYMAEVSNPYWFETLGWTVDVKNTGTAGLDANVILAGYDDQGRLADNFLKDCSGDSYLEVGAEKTFGASLSGDISKIRAFVWDSRNYNPLCEDTKLITNTIEKEAKSKGSGQVRSGDETIHVQTDTGQSTVKVTLHDETLKGKRLSLACYDPMADGKFEDINKNADAIVYLDQFAMEDETAEISFGLREELKEGDYYVVIGTQEGMLSKSFSFDIGIKGADTTRLKALVDSVAKTDLTRYTDVSAAAFTAALNAAREILQKQNAAQSEADQAFENLSRAVSGLALKTDAGKPDPEKPAEPVNPTATALKKGTKFQYKGIKYKVTNNKKGAEQAAVTGAVKKSAVSVKIPAKAVYKGISYKVTAISDSAFAKYKKLKKVAVGENVTVIGKRAFYGDGRLRTIIIKSRKLHQVKKQALKGINKKAVIKVPGKKLKKYKQALTGKGQAKTVRIK